MSFSPNEKKYELSPFFLNFPSHSTGFLTEKVWEEIYENPKNHHLIPQFLTSEVYIQKGDIQKFFPNKPLVFINPITDVALLQKNRSHIKLVISGFTNSATDIHFFKSIITQALQKKKKILYLTHTNLEDFNFFSTFFQNEIKNLDFMFFNPYSFLEHSKGAPELQEILMFAEIKWYEFNKILKKLNLCLPSHISNDFFQITGMEYHFEKNHKFLFPNNLISRVNWSPYHAMPAKFNQELKGKSVSFQHSVVTGRAGFFPIFHDVYYCYGKTSQAFYEKNYADTCSHLIPSQTMNKKIQFKPYGAYWEAPVEKNKTPNSSKQILFLDQSSHWSLPYFDLKTRIEKFQLSLKNFVHFLEKENTTLVIRPHPEGLHENYWNSLQGISKNIQLSNHSLTVQKEIENSKIILGFFSQSLLGAAKAGYPVLFIKDPGDYLPLELHDFNDYIFTTEQYPLQIQKLLSEPEEYLKYARALEIKASRYLSPLPENLSNEILDFFNL